MIILIGGIYVNPDHIICWNPQKLYLTSRFDIDLGPGAAEALAEAFKKHLRHNIATVPNEVLQEKIQGTPTQAVPEVPVADQVPGHAFLVSAPSSYDDSNEDVSGRMVSPEDLPPPPPIEYPPTSQE